jgi:hypothetical protein
VNKLAPFNLALALVSCETPLRSAQAMFHTGVQCGPYRFAGVWNKHDRFLYYCVDKNWDEIEGPAISAKLNADLNWKKNYRYRGHRCYVVELLPTGKPPWMPQPAVPPTIGESRNGCDWTVPEAH